MISEEGILFLFLVFVFFSTGGRFAWRSGNKGQFGGGGGSREEREKRDVRREEDGIVGNDEADG